MKNTVALLVGISIILTMSSCAPTATQIRRTLEENPDIIVSVIEKNPDKIIDALNKAATDARLKAREREQKDEQARRDEEFNSPKSPVIADGRAIIGNKDAPITIVEYSDLQCPFCRQGNETVKEVMREYGDKVRLIFKHFPLENIHPDAMMAAHYFEAIARQGVAKAVAWHDELFNTQDQLRKEREKWLESLAKKHGINMVQLKKDLADPKIDQTIKEDMAEAQKFGFSGTPGFLINGVSLKGAYPFEEFKIIIDKHLKGKG